MTMRDIADLRRWHRQGVERAMRATRPGALVSEVHHAAFAAYIERGFLESANARSMPSNWSANPDGTPRPCVEILP